MIRRIVWSAVIAGLLGVATVILAVLEMPQAIPVGLTAVTAAILSNREVR